MTDWLTNLVFDYYDWVEGMITVFNFGMEG